MKTRFDTHVIMFLETFEYVFMQSTCVMVDILLVHIGGY
jgi:hypothetical protein